MSDPRPTGASAAGGARPAGPSSNLRPARTGAAGAAGARRRGLLLVLVVAVLIGGALLSRAGGGSGAGVTGPAAAAASVTPVAESTSWYCTAMTGQGGSMAVGALAATNTTSHPVNGTVTVVNDGGADKSVPVSLPPDRTSTLDPAALQGGNWLATRVDLSSGGVMVTESVSGPLGWSSAPCASVTSPTWYFASGSTSGGNRQWVALYNPTASPAVVDLTFATSSGVTQPQPFAGIVLAPGRVAVENIGAYVQGDRSVSTIVSAESGRVVAFELLALTDGGVQGLSLQLGSPSPHPAWALPRSLDATGSGASTALAVFNPTPSGQRVTVTIQLPSGPVAPVSQFVGPDSTWSLSTSTLSRIPANTSFSSTVTAAGGPGVVVGRLTQASTSASTPQAGADGAVPVAGVRHAIEWWLPGPGTVAAPAVDGAAPYSVTVANPSAKAVAVSITYLTPSGLRALGPEASATIPAGRFVVIPKQVLAPAALDALSVVASSPVAVTEDLVPSGTPGVVTLSGIPTEG